MRLQTTLGQSDPRTRIRTTRKKGGEGVVSRVSLWKVRPDIFLAVRVRSVRAMMTPTLMIVSARVPRLPAGAHPANRGETSLYSLSFLFPS